MKIYFENGVTVIDIGGLEVSGRTNKTGYRGIKFLKDRQIYHANIHLNKKKYHLGEFTHIEDAVAIRSEAETHIANGDFLEWFETLYGTVKRNKRTKGK